MSVFLAMDAGGTKTEYLLADEERVLAHGWSGDDAIEGAVYPRHGRLVDGLGKTVLPDAQLGA